VVKPLSPHLSSSLIPANGSKNSGSVSSALEEPMPESAVWERVAEVSVCGKLLPVIPDGCVVESSRVELDWVAKG